MIRAGHAFAAEGPASVADLAALLDSCREDRAAADLVSDEAAAARGYGRAGTRTVGARAFTFDPQHN